MTWQVIQADARDMPLDDDSVDLIVTSPPYWGLRSYRDAGEHYDGQIGSEDTPQQFVDELVGMIDSEWRRVLKPVGSLWLNLGDKYAGSGGAGTTSGLGAAPASTRNSDTVFPKGLESARPKSLLGLPWRVALALIDRGWILRAEVIWSKPNGLPESATDRVRRSHEQWFHFTLEPRYFSAVDEIREPHIGEPHKPGRKQQSDTRNDGDRQDTEWDHNPLGRLPGSVWTIPTEPLIIPDAVKEQLGLVDHFAAFPQEWPRRLIMGWSPSGVCVVCGEGLRPVVGKSASGKRRNDHGMGARHTDRAVGMDVANATEVAVNRSEWREGVVASITGYLCACGTPGTTRPAVVLDPFGGTGTTAGVAHALGRHGISIDLSADYCRLAEWRIAQSGHFQKSRQRMWADRQETLL